MFNNELWNKPAGGGGSDFYSYQIANSARFDGSASYLNKTWGSAPSSTTQVALSVWLKKTFTGDVNPVSIFTAVGNTGSFYFNNDDAIADNLAYYMGSGGVNGYTTNIRYRDPSAWFHFVAIINSAASNDYDRLKIYINGELIALNGGEWTQNAGYPNTTPPDAGKNGVANYIGRYGSASRYWSGYMADFIQIDGAAAISDFGELKNGVWIPKDPSGLTFGNNGFHLDFASSGDMGNDVSGKNNDWTANSIVASDQMGDSPTFSATAGNGGNFATIGGLEKNTGGFTFSEGNLKYAVGTNQRGFITSTGIPESGKYYWEVRVTQFGGAQDAVFPGVCVPDIMRSNLTGDRGGAAVSGAGGYTVDNYQGAFMLNGVAQSADGIGTARSVPQTFGIAIDRDNNTFKWTYNGSSYSSTYAIPSSGVLAPYLGSGGGGNTASGVFNFGADSTFAGLVSAGGNADENGFGDFSLAVPSGYVALCSGNLPIDATVDPAQTEDNFAKKLFGSWRYTGNNGARTISTIGENGFGIQQDLHIMRSDTYAQTPYWMNTTEGIFGASSNNYYIGSNGTSAQATLPQYNFVSQSGTNYNITGGTWFNSGSTPMVGIGWRFNGGTTVSNGNGDLTSTVQLDSSTCASIVTYTGTLSGVGVQTVGHGLSKAPNYIITKGLGKSGNWWVWSDSQTSWNYGMNLNNSNVSVDKSGNGSMSAPTSTVFSTNYTDGINDGAGSKMIAYCFANCPGYIHSGEYVGNGNTDGSFVYTGFKPAFVMVKYIGNNHSGAAGESWSYSNANSSPFNPVQKRLSMNSDNAQSDSSTFELDYLSNGFKMRTTWEGYNGNNYIISYIAFAENSNKYATAR